MLRPCRQMLLAECTPGACVGIEEDIGKASARAELACRIAQQRSVGGKFGGVFRPEVEHRSLCPFGRKRIELSLALIERDGRQLRGLRNRVPHHIAARGEQLLGLQPHHILSEFSWLVGVFNVNFHNALPYVGRRVFFLGLVVVFLGGKL